MEALLKFCSYQLQIWTEVIYSDDYVTLQADFGHVTVPSGFKSPEKISIGELGFSPRVHNTYAEDVIILNSRQFQFVNLVYDGQGPGMVISFSLKPRCLSFNVSQRRELPWCGKPCHKFGKVFQT